MSLGDKLLTLFRYSGIVMILYLGFQYTATWKTVREDYSGNCHAFCEGQLANLETLEFNIANGVILCKCDNLNIKFYGNNYTYTRTPNITDILGGGIKK